MERDNEIGFYWVKTFDIDDDRHPQIGKWEVAFYDGEGGLLLCGNECYKPLEYFSEVGERVTTPERCQPIRDSR